jgi:hypothetical protein
LLCIYTTSSSVNNTVMPQHVQVCSIVILIKNSKYFPAHSEGHFSVMERLREPWNVNAERL